MSFIQDMALNPYLLPGVVAGLLASVACGIVGPYVVTRRFVMLSGAIAHTAFGGVGAALFILSFQQGMRSPAYTQRMVIFGAMVAAILGALIIGLVQQRARERVDTLIGAVWVIGMSLGIMLLKYVGGYGTNPMTYLFGNLAYLMWDDVWIIVALNVVILTTVALLHKRFMSVCIDEQHAGLQGVNTLTTNLLLLVLVAVTSVILMQVVGLIMVIALLSLPAATAGHHLRRMSQIIWASIALCMLLMTLPRMAMYGTRVSPESAIVLAAGIVYLLSVTVRRYRLGKA